VHTNVTALAGAESRHAKGGCRAEHHSVAGMLCHKKEPGVVEIEQFKVEVVPEGHMLFIVGYIARSWRIPGFRLLRRRRVRR
jgi:hypothetical protein